MTKSNWVEMSNDDIWEALLELREDSVTIKTIFFIAEVEKWDRVTILHNLSYILVDIFGRLLADYAELRRSRTVIQPVIIDKMGGNC